MNRLSEVWISEVSLYILFLYQYILQQRINISMLKTHLVHIIHMHNTHPPTTVAKIRIINCTQMPSYCNRYAIDCLTQNMYTNMTLADTINLRLISEFGLKLRLANSSLARSKIQGSHIGSEFREVSTLVFW